MLIVLLKRTKITSCYKPVTNRVELGERDVDIYSEELC